MSDTADRVVAAYQAVAEASGREAAVVGGLRCVVFGVDEPWAAQVLVMDEPRAEALAAARAWLHDRSPGCVVMTRKRYLSHPVLAGFSDVHEMPALVLRSAPVTWDEPAGASIGPARDPAEFLAVYGIQLAPLVTAADFVDPALTHLVARVNGTPVAVAQVRVAGGAAYVSAVTVASSHRRRGFGTAISAAATQQAASTGAEFVWLHATATSRPIYERLGYQLVDTHVQLS